MPRLEDHFPSEQLTKLGKEAVRQPEIELQAGRQLDKNGTERRP
jgi:hypothetical protein